MSAPKMYKVKWEANGHTGERFFGTHDVQRIHNYFSSFPVKHTITIEESEYKIGNIIEYVDNMAEDESNGTVKKAVICGFKDDRLSVETVGWERWLFSPADEYKIIGNVAVNEDGYIDSMENVREVIRSAA
jgi:hypothetical protein